MSWAQHLEVMRLWCLWNVSWLTVIIINGLVMMTKGIVSVGLLVWQACYQSPLQYLSSQPTTPRYKNKIWRQLLSLRVLSLYFPSKMLKFWILDLRFASFCFQYDNIYYAKYIRGEWWGGRNSDKQDYIIMSGGRLSIQSAPAASQDYYGQTSQSSAHINCLSKRWADNTR